MEDRDLTKISDQYKYLFYKKTDYTPEEMIEAWNGLFEIIENGYDDFDPELDYDLSFRDEIEKTLNDPELLNFAMHDQFSREISRIDERMKPLMFPNPTISRRENSKWWHLVVLRKGGPTYVKDIKEAYDIDVPLADA